MEWEDELRRWIVWRLEQATPEARLRGEIALFGCPTALDPPCDRARSRRERG